ncbi:hypothetical protein F4V43_01760 [Paenibacillus spiritus]|uniref:Uncharacterized protein n=1 Tax=Paenibacillus spiritus TaxID=2496557 RepID=A0A5J5GGL0_9BACL|nr:hypothetical protein [Paenibacillus spiritus]KAA9007237.1 hypothetical protein F4V43_01760 [Paenibacillus spiritus]
MNYIVSIKRYLGLHNETSEIVKFTVQVDVQDIYMMLAEDDAFESDQLSIEYAMKAYAVELAMNKFFKQHYILSPGSKIEVLSVEEVDKKKESSCYYSPQITANAKEEPIEDFFKSLQKYMGLED